MSDSTESGTSKRGRTEVRIMDAAAQLFAERGANGVSVRDVAERAGVSHALVHRYFGSKDDLVRAAILQARTKLADAARQAHDADEFVDALLDAGLEDPLIARMMMRSTLEGWSGEQIDPHYPIVGSGITLLRQNGIPDVAGQTQPFDPRIVMGGVAALVLGWTTAEPRFVQSAGLEDDDLTHVRGEIKRLMRLMMAMADDEAMH